MQSQVVPSGPPAARGFWRTLPSGRTPRSLGTPGRRRLLGRRREGAAARSGAWGEARLTGKGSAPRPPTPNPAPCAATSCAPPAPFSPGPPAQRLSTARSPPAPDAMQSCVAARGARFAGGTGANPPGYRGGRAPAVAGRGGRVQRRGGAAALLTARAAHRTARSPTRAPADPPPDAHARRRAERPQGARGGQQSHGRAPRRGAWAGAWGRQGQLHCAGGRPRRPRRRARCSLSRRLRGPAPLRPAPRPRRARTVL
jgi:hypothetical protein